MRVSLLIAALLGAAQPAIAGPITVAEAWSRATPLGAKVGAGYLTIRNEGRTADRLISTTSNVAKTVEVHSSSKSGGVMRMRRIESLEVPAGGEVKLEPGGTHIMFIGLARPLKEGETIPAVLRFANAGAVEVTFKVQPLGAMQPSEQQHAQGHSGH